MELHYLTSSFLYFSIGAILGSFLNVIILRIPKNISIVAPRSHCFNCNNPIPFYLNIPIISYLMLKGKCHKCSSSISKQYISVEIIMGALLCMISNNMNLSQSILISIIFSSFIVIGAIDYRHLLIPKIMLIILFSTLIIRPIIFQQTFINMITGASMLMLYIGTLILFIGLIKKNFNMIGFGDILLLIFIGAWLGVINSFICLFISSIIGIAMSRLPFTKYYSENKIPFGFCLSASFILISLLVDCYKIKLLFF